MHEDDKQILIGRYLAAYNAFDIDGMMAVLHPDIEFQNVSGGAVNATASGANAFRALAGQSAGLFSMRRQTMTRFDAQDDQACIGVEFEGVLAADLANGMQAGETLRLTGRTEFAFRDGRICRITDIS